MPDTVEHKYYRLLHTMQKIQKRPPNVEPIDLSAKQPKNANNDQNTPPMFLLTPLKEVICGKEYFVYGCKMCELTFIDKNMLKGHYKMIHGIIVPLTNAPKKKPYHCRLCGLNFEMRINFLGHMRFIHKVTVIRNPSRKIVPGQDGDPPGCSFIAPKHTGNPTLAKPPSMNYSCPVCFKRCYSKNHLNVHRLQHSEPYFCRTCKVGLLDLSTHKSCRVIEVFYECNFCKMPLRGRNEVITHVYSVHGRQYN